jgi:hypothetical protein
MMCLQRPWMWLQIRYRTERQKNELLEKARCGHHLKPWTADRSSSSFKEVEGKVRETVGSQARTFQPSQGCVNMGKERLDFLRLCCAVPHPTRVVLHPRGILIRVPEIGEFVTIEYSDRQAAVTTLPLAGCSPRLETSNCLSKPRLVRCIRRSRGVSSTNPSKGGPTPACLISGYFSYHVRHDLTWRRCLQCLSLFQDCRRPIRTASRR